MEAQDIVLNVEEQQQRLIEDLLKQAVDALTDAMTQLKEIESTRH